MMWIVAVIHLAVLIVLLNFFVVFNCLIINYPFAQCEAV